MRLFFKRLSTTTKYVKNVFFVKTLTIYIAEDFTQKKPCASKCFPDAKKVIFDPNMSYTVQANISIERFLQSEELSKIHQQFVNASQQADR